MFNPKEIQWVFFDLGNTLIDESAPSRHRACEIGRVLRHSGRPVSTDDIIRAIEIACRAFAPSPIHRVMEILGLSPDAIRLMNLTSLYKKELECPFPGATELLDRLATHHSLGIIANQRAGTLRRLTALGWGSRFQVCITSAEVGLEKPDPAIYRLALNKAQCQPTAAAMVGDRLDNDIWPAKALGIRTIRVLQGFHRVQTPRHAAEEPDLTVPTVLDVGSALCPVV
jgi:HAD superfamily hydrolase (TIGR01549 family)